jgi:hypothetical protein
MNSWSSVEGARALIPVGLNPPGLSQIVATGMTSQCTLSSRDEVTDPAERK